VTAVGAWDSEQVANAAVIIKVGVRMGVPARGWIIAIATAMQESSLRNNALATDRDSLGLFQQRPSQGWGSPEQVMDPDHAAASFYARLLATPGWPDMALTVAAQAVQHSAYPDAYATWEDEATSLVATLTGMGPALCSTEVGPQGWSKPVDGPIVSGFRTPQRPTHNGVDIGVARGTVIHAAASGTVIRVRCNAVYADTGADWGCDRDGDPVRTKGCGWYTDVSHPGNVITRYCHMGSEPWVKVGHPVAAGQPLGVVGSTGNSSGPHLHFEVHINGDENASGVIDPVPWMRDHGASLGASR
jgi:murein DD-endopeptidase MepM/ murein hydrolase activator NlpD